MQDGMKRAFGNFFRMVGNGYSPFCFRMVENKMASRGVIQLETMFLEN